MATGVAQWHSQRTAASQLNTFPPTPLAPAFAEAQVAALAIHQLQPPATLTINAVGDIIPGTDYQMYRLPQDWQSLFRGRIIPVALDPNGVSYLDDDFQSVVLLRSYTQRDFPLCRLANDQRQGGDVR